MSASRSRVLSAFRRLNRARIQLFQGDEHAMAVTHQQMRAEFERNRHVPTTGPEFEAMLAGIDEAATMLKHEIIRGELNNDTGRYRTYQIETPRTIQKSHCWQHAYPWSNFHDSHFHFFSFAHFLLLLFDLFV